MPFRNTIQQGRDYYRDYVSDPAGAAKNACRRKTRAAIESGILVRQPCEKCGEERSQAHHEDYSRPLDIRWLCRKCHSEEHRKTHCKRGHEMAGDNVIFINGKRNVCRKCQSIANRARYIAKKSGHQK